MEALAWMGGVFSIVLPTLYSISNTDLHMNCPPHRTIKGIIFYGAAAAGILSIHKARFILEREAFVKWNEVGKIAFIYEILRVH